MASGSPSSRRQISHHRPDGVRVDLEAGAHGGGPVGEQPHRRRTPARCSGRRVRRRQTERGDRGQRLAGDRRAAPGWWPGCAAAGSGQQLGRRAARPRRSGARSCPARAARAGRRAASTSRVSASALARLRRRRSDALAQPDARRARPAGPRAASLIGASSASQTPSAEPVQHPGRGLGGQPGLAGATRADEGDQPVPVEQLGDRGQVVVPADEAGELGRHVASPAHGAAARPASGGRPAAPAGGSPAAPGRGRRRARRPAAGATSSYAASASACRPAA